MPSESIGRVEQESQQHLIGVGDRISKDERNPVIFSNSARLLDWGYVHGADSLNVFRWSTRSKTISDIG
jgi:hypothetical protein